MELKRKNRNASQRGMSLIELLIASLVLTVGVLAVAALIPIAIGTNSRNKQQSNSTVIAQMAMEKISSVPVSGVPTVTITDCAGNAHVINVTGSTAGTGATLLPSGSVDFGPAQGSASAPAGYFMSYTTCGTNGQQSVYDVRWNIQDPTNYVKIVTVSAKYQGAGNNALLFSLPVTIRSMVGGN